MASGQMFIGVFSIIIQLSTKAITTTSMENFHLWNSKYRSEADYDPLPSSYRINQYSWLGCTLSAAIAARLGSCSDPVHSPRNRDRRFNYRTRTGATKSFPFDVTATCAENHTYKPVPAVPSTIALHSQNHLDHALRNVFGILVCRADARYPTFSRKSLINADTLFSATFGCLYGAYIIDVGRGDTTMLLVALPSCLLGYGEVGLWLHSRIVAEEKRSADNRNSWKRRSLGYPGRQPTFNGSKKERNQSAVKMGLATIEARAADPPSKHSGILCDMELKKGF
ncbi:hypothetical protein BDP27DRAFT_1366822 [Rhodocollybia butyracea]|uniref:Uncharacterized protein n=1 Tax=Rhodocollybia butyracea TaxID=206335 RepID=A0A9P5U3T1_9AGAR|nr:hypothetical protein BDP27DRAFT_1366822 [Rhodocollybia butyracea]